MNTGLQQGACFPLRERHARLGLYISEFVFFEMRNGKEYTGAEAFDRAGVKEVVIELEVVDDRAGNGNNWGASNK